MVILDDEEYDKVWDIWKKLIEEFKKADLEGFKLIEEKN